MYRIEAPSNRIKQELKRTPRDIRARIAEAVRALAEDPRPDGIRQLEPDVYRLRVGQYRVIYKVLDDEQLVLIGRITRRGEATYRDVSQLFR
ncbi:MAG TPA: type II toxin-antitoxin system RelE/ParE family toxin [Anaerolineae bacterium]|nr:type II toxin-antitoxin system RelE/ParE family toxin [Anaerolineae bacterium]